MTKVGNNVISLERLDKILNKTNIADCLRQQKASTRYLLHVTNELRFYFLIVAQKGVCYGLSLFLKYPYTTTPLPPLPRIIVRTLYCMKFAWLGEVR